MMNPYFSYLFSFSIALLIYRLPWSSVYPTLTSPIQLFLCSTFLIAGAAGHFWKRRLAQWHELPVFTDKRPLTITLFIYILWLADFVYEGGVPLFKIILDQPYDYRAFGVPSLHVFTVTFSSFYTVYLFHLYLNRREKFLLLLYGINLFAAVLIYNRGMLCFNLVGSIFLFWFSSRRISLRFLLLSPFVFILLVYLFGVFGTLRVSRDHHSPYDNAIFLELGQATEEFRQSRVPEEFFWSYIYLTSPIANLQQNINLTVQDTLSVRKIGQLVTNEFLFDFISKRTNLIFGLTPEIEGRIPGPFNASTVYSRSFWILRWYGIFAMALFILVLPFVYERFLEPLSPYSLTGLAILCTMYLFMVFDNTIRFTGLGFQLVYPVLAGWLHRQNIFRLAK